MLISEVSEKTGLPISTLRYYERRGILQPHKNDSGYRCYSDHDLAWIEFVQRLLQIGMPFTKSRNTHGFVNKAIRRYPTG